MLQEHSELGVNYYLLKKILIMTWSGNNQIQ